MNNQSVVVVSHRRSGTHLTVDALLNNFECFSRNTDVTSFTVDHVFNATREGYEKDVEKFMRSLEMRPKVIKTHSVSDIDAYFKSLSGKQYEDLSRLLDGCKKIYVYRGGMDVIVSLYFYQKKYRPALEKVSFSEFLRQPNDLDLFADAGRMSRPEFWAKHLSGWLFGNEDVLPVKFDEMTNDPEETIAKISDFIGMKHADNVRDVSLSSPEQLAQGEGGAPVARTSISFRKGQVGDWKNHFSDDDVAFFKDEVSKVSSELLEFIE